MRLIACLIARDEEANLPRCLESLAGAVDGICLLDTGSTDGTMGIARSFGARTGSLPWSDDFSVSRNACLDLADGDWILQVDADEELDRATVAALRRSMEGPGHCRLVEVSLLDGTDRPGSVLLPRLFRRDPRIRYRRALHESVLDSIVESGLGEPVAVPVRLLHHGYTPDAVAQKEKRERNVRILRGVRERKVADAYDLYKLGTTLPGWGTDGPERSAALDSAWELSLEAPGSLRAQWPWWPSLARATALDLAFRGRLQDAWNVLELARKSGERPALEGARAEILLRSGRPVDALATVERALSLPSESALAASDGKERAALVHLAARCAREAGQPFIPFLEEAAALGQFDARCDLALARIEQGVASGWNELDLILRRHANHPVALIAASEAARSQGDRSTSDLLLEQASRIPSEGGLRARARRWMRAWLTGSSPTFDLPASDVENSAAQAVDRIVNGLPWTPDPFLSPGALRKALADILEAILGAGREDVVRAFARNSRGRDADLPGISTLVLED